MNPLQQLQVLGQSPWHDNIRRDQLESGELARMVAAGDITGLTSNPTIFQQAISGSDNYDASIRAHAQQGTGAEEIFYALASEDIQAAADIFRPVYDRSAGRDGFVSLEISPRLAHETEASVREALHLWQRVARPNLMIKIPATRPGLAAITASIRAGVNVNVTLIFSLQRYADVMDAHMSGLEERLAAGEDISGVASVASFFVSRLDTLVDARLDELAETDPGAAELMGFTAIANARLAYTLFHETIGSRRWAALQAAGARVQRPLWASTSTKNPRYRDVLYVEALIGVDTVNTMPPHTLQAFKQHGHAEETITAGTDAARAHMARLADLDIDMAAVTDKLEADGVSAFAQSFERLLEVIEQRSRTLRPERA
ncbi:MAG: transaldolase [Anaerolineales bacterium]|jgi:transaldolase|nr:transaldolase [Anaerolineales bacterium]